MSNNKPGRWDRFGNNKPSFNIFLRSEYGDSNWNHDLFGVGSDFYKDIRLRGGNNDVKNPFVRDELVRRLFLRMGHVGSKGILSTLFVNGDLKGYYNPVESLKESFFQAKLDSELEWDVIKINGPDSGDLVEWQRMITLIKEGDITDLDVYTQVLKALDIDNFIDYIILNAYGAVRDWPFNNWIASRERSPTGQWRYHVWDAEASFGEVPESDVEFNLFPGIVHREDWASLGEVQWGIPIIYTRLSESLEFRMRFADRIEKHFSTSGALCKENVIMEAEKLLSSINPIMNSIRGTDVLNPFTPWAMAREVHVLSHFADEGLMTGLKAPLAILDDAANSSFGLLTLINPNELGQIFYTVDGSDPRLRGGQIGGVQFDRPIEVRQSLTIKARVLHEGEWSALLERTLSGREESDVELSYNHIWRYEDSGVDLGNDWREPSYDDSTWRIGPGLIGNENAELGEPIRTEIDLANQNTVYFRTEFNFWGNVKETQLELSGYVDDGMVVYLNGGEILRYLMPEGEINYSSPGSGVNNATESDRFILPGALLAYGRNVLAAEVHQVLPGSSDLVFGLNFVAKRPEIVFSEIMYHPESDNPEFIEIRNDGVVSVDLTGWSLREAVSFEFPDGGVIKPGEVFVVSDSESLFMDSYPEVPLRGTYSGKLNNGGERLVIADSFGNEVSVLNYSDSVPWPKRLVDGGGHSLTKADDSVGYWCASSLRGGSPGVDDRHVLPHSFDCWRRLYGAGEANMDDDADGISNLLEYAFGTAFSSSSGLDMSISDPEVDNSSVDIETSWNDLAEDMQITLQVSEDVDLWRNVSDVVERKEENFRSFTIPLINASWRFYRFKVDALW